MNAILIGFETELAMRGEDLTWIRRLGLWGSFSGLVRLLFLVVLLVPVRFWIGILH